MRPSHSDGTGCLPTKELFSRIGDKWSLMILTSLHDGKLRFGEIRNEMNGISQKMLTMTLRALEREGFVSRTVHPTVPPRVDYELTILGGELSEQVRTLGLWAQHNSERIAAARAAFDER